MGAAGFLRVLSCRLAFFRRKNQHYRGFNAKSSKSPVFYRALCGPCPGSPDPTTLSRIRPGRALRHGKGATRRKGRRQNTVLSERRLRRSRARGSVDFRNCQHYRGSGASDGAKPVNLRKIWNTRFWNCQHYRGCAASDRATPANLRKIRSVRFWNGQHYRGCEASDRAMPVNLRRI